MHLLPRVFFMLEGKLGRSTLQNYNAILTGDFLAFDASPLWLIGLFLTAGMPIALSVGYKQSLGGTVTYDKTPRTPREYGLNYPTLGDYATMNNSIYLMIHSAAAMMTAASNDSTRLPKYPAPYGFNLLLLNERTAAALDIPSSNYLRGILGEMKGNETWTINATVNAFVATFNASTESLKADQDFLNQTLKTDEPLHSFSLFDRYNEFSALLGYPQDTDGVYYLLGSYPVSGGQGPPITDVDVVTDGKLTDEERFTSFIQHSQMFNIRRQQCRGAWHMDKSGSLKLIGGSCTGPGRSSAYLRDVQMRPFYLDAFPVLAHSLGKFAMSPRNESKWRDPSYAVAAVTTLWARAIHMRDHAFELPEASNLQYTALEDERVQVTIETLKFDWGLLTILLIQPVLTFIAFLLCCFYIHKLPIGKGFGLVSILSGVTRDSLDELKGASFSGKPVRPLSLQILPISTSDGSGTIHHSIQYTLIDSTGARRDEVGTINPTIRYE